MKLQPCYQLFLCFIKLPSFRFLKLKYSNILLSVHTILSPLSDIVCKVHKNILICCNFKTFFILDNSRHEINKEVDAFTENFLGTLPNCSLVKNLERLHLKSISCSPNDMHFIKHVLLYARNLQMASVENFKGQEFCFRCIKNAQRIWKSITSSKDLFSTSGLLLVGLVWCE